MSNLSNVFFFGLSFPERLAVSFVDYSFLNFTIGHFSLTSFNTSFSVQWPLTTGLTRKDHRAFYSNFSFCLSLQSGEALQYVCVF